MLTRIVAKFVCDRITRTRYGTGEVELSPVTGGSPENESFWKATPSGNLTMTIDNPLAFDAFEPGAEYTLTFDRVSPPIPGADGSVATGSPGA